MSSPARGRRSEPGATCSSSRWWAQTTTTPSRFAKSGTLPKVGYLRTLITAMMRRSSSWRECTAVGWDRDLTCGAGESFFAPRGTPHAFKNVGDAQARMLIAQSPGGVIEKYMEEAWEKIEDPSNPPPVEPDFERIMTVAQKYGIEMLPPA